MTEDTRNSLDDLFYPKSIAVIGASTKSNHGGFGPGGPAANNYIKGSITMNFKGKIYPVHPKGKDTLGFTTYRSVRDIPGDVDLVIFAIPAAASLDVMKDCAAKGVKYAHLFTAGFSETGIEAFASLEKKLLEVARKGGIRVVGPNCMGLYCPEGGLSFQPHFPEIPGSVGFFSQSGQLTGFFVMKGESIGLRFSKVVSFGNASDLKAHNFLDYLAHDKSTTAIGSYIEGLKDGRLFFETARKMTREKPLVIYKGGQTDGGSRATRSHTGAIAGSQAIWNAMCKQAGIISADSLDEIAYTISALEKLELPEGKGVAILGGAGGGSVTMTDIAEKSGLSVPQLSDTSIAKLREFIPAHGSSVKNPMDIGGHAFMGPNLEKVITILRDDPNIDGMIMSLPIAMAYRMMGREIIDLIVEQTRTILKIFQKPLFLALEKDDGLGGEDAARDVIERLKNSGIPFFPSFEMAAKILDRLYDYNLFLTRKQEN